MPAINDLLYFDAHKTASLLRQFNEGKDAPLAPQDGLVLLQKHLFDGGLAADLNASVDAKVAEVAPIQARLAGAYALRAEGWCTIEDYARFKHVADNSNAIIEFIGRCTIHALEQSEEYKKAQQELDNVRAVTKKEVDRNKRATLEARVKGMESKFRALVAEKTKLEGLPDWMVGGFGLFIEAFLKGRISLRVFPFDGVPEFSLISNLKPDCFVDGSLDNILAAYGSQPTIKLTVLGTITSIPGAEGKKLDTMAQFRRLGEQNRDVKLEQALRQFFNAMEMLEGLVGLSRYPNVTVYPLAVYRRVELAQKS